MDAKWVSVDKRQPTSNVPVLVTDGNQILVGEWGEEYGVRTGWRAVGVEGYEWEWDFENYDQDSPITHWMSLPEFPIKK